MTHGILCYFLLISGVYQIHQLHQGLQRTGLYRLRFPGYPCRRRLGRQEAGSPVPE